MKTLLFCIVLALLTSPAGAADTWYVDANASGGATGKDRANAFLEFAPVADSVALGDTVLVWKKTAGYQDTLDLSAITANTLLNSDQYRIDSAVVFIAMEPGVFYDATSAAKSGQIKGAYSYVWFKGFSFENDASGYIFDSAVGKGNWIFVECYFKANGFNGRVLQNSQKLELLSSLVHSVGGNESFMFRNCKDILAINTTFDGIYTNYMSINGAGGIATFTNCIFKVTNGSNRLMWEAHSGSHTVVNHSYFDTDIDTTGMKLLSGDDYFTADVTYTFADLFPDFQYSLDTNAGLNVGTGDGNIPVGYPPVGLQVGGKNQ